MNTITKKFRWVFLLFLGAVLFASCHAAISEQRLGDWQSKAGYLGLGRNGAVSFVIGNKAYVGTGFNRDNNVYLNDFYMYDPDLNKWTQVASFPGLGRQNAVGFSINGIGYVGTGLNGNNGNIQELSDFYSYDPVADAWTQVASLPGTARRGAAVFVVNNIAYVGTGISTAVTGVTNGLSDIYSYDPTANTWTPATSYPGPKVYGAFTFVINNEAYMGGGTIPGSVTAADNSFWKFDPSSSTWTKQPSLDSLSTQVKRFTCASFSSNGLGYAICGGPGALSSAFEYNPANKIWTQKTDFESTVSAGRADCVGFALTTTNGYSLFVGLGTPNSNSSPLDDFMAMNPLIIRIANN